MSYAATLIGLAAVHLAANASPGPNFLLLSRVAAGQSRSAGLTVALGLTVGAGIWAAMAALGLGALSAMAWLQDTLRLIGGAYLVYLGLCIAWRADGVFDSAIQGGMVDWTSFRLGVMTNLANPLSLLFFGAIFAALLPPTLPTWVRIAAVAVIVADALIWYVALAFAFSLPPVRQVYCRMKRRLDQLMGSLLAVFGVRLMLTMR